MSNAIKKITITIGDEDHELTPAQAKELRDALNEIYPPVHDRILPVPFERPRRPWSPWGDRVWCQSNTAEDQTSKFVSAVMNEDGESFQAARITI